MPLAELLPSNFARKMRRALIGTALALVSLSSAQSADVPKPIDVSGVDAFWSLVDDLRAGEPLTDATWTAFISVEGNRRLIAEAYSPAMLADLRGSIVAAVRGEKTATQFNALPLMEAMLADEPRLRQFSKSYGGPSTLNAAYERSYTALPTCFAQKALRVGDVQIHLEALNDGATAIGNPPAIYMSLALAAVEDAVAPNATLGHELQHLLRPSLEFNVPPRDRPLLAALSAILNEASADLADAPLKIGKPKFARWEHWIRDGADSSILQLDALIQTLARSSEGPTSADFQKVLKSSGGHIPGLIMVETIVRAGLKPELLAHIDDPFEFLILYDRASRVANGAPQLSRVSIAYVKDLRTAAGKGRPNGLFTVDCNPVPQR